jgi:hypothetical protein
MLTISLSLPSGRGSVIGARGLVIGARGSVVCSDSWCVLSSRDRKGACHE